MSRDASPPFQVAAIDHVELYVPGRREAARWYSEVLGLEVVPKCAHWAEDAHGPLMISPDGGTTMLALFRGDPQGARKTAGFHRVAFRVGAPGFIRFLERLPHLGLKDGDGREVAPTDVKNHGRAVSLYFTDPHGHRLEITTYDPAPVWRFLQQAGS